MDLRAGIVIAGACFSACSYPFAEADLGERAAATELVDASLNAGIPPEATVSLERERYRWGAEDWTAGHVREVGPDYLVIESVTPGVGLVRLGLPENPPVFEGNTPVPLSRVTFGVAARANFISKHTTQPVLVSLELMSPGQLTHLAQR